MRSVARLQIRCGCNDLRRGCLRFRQRVLKTETDVGKRHREEFKVAIGHIAVEGRNISPEPKASREMHRSGHLPAASAHRSADNSCDLLCKFGLQPQGSLHNAAESRIVFTEHLLAVDRNRLIVLMSYITAGEGCPFRSLGPSRVR